MITPGRRRRVAAHGLLRDPDGRVLLVPAPGDGWTLPGTTVVHGESPYAAVTRLGLPATGAPVVLAATADQVTLPGAVVHHDRLVFELAGAGGPVPGGTWFEPAEIAGLRLVTYAHEVLDGKGDPIPAADPDVGWSVDRGLATDVTGPRPRVQRFSTYAHAVDPAGRVLLARIAPGFPSAGQWHLPGGGTDFGESPAAALLREVVEETGQRGRVLDLVGVSHRHNPHALGWEGYRIDWHTIRLVYRVVVDEPDEPRVTEAAGGSTADATWIAPDDLHRASLTDLAAAVLTPDAVRRR